MIRNPCSVITEYEATGNHQLGKDRRLDSMRPMPSKIQTSLGKGINRRWLVRVLVCIEVKVKLPGAVLSHGTIVVYKSDSQLYKLENIDVTSHRLIVVVCGCLELANRPRNNSWKLAILS